MIKSADKEIDVAINIIEEQPKSQDEFDYVVKVLCQFEGIGDRMKTYHKLHKHQIIRSLQVENVLQGTYLIRKGEIFRKCYVLIQGKLNCYEQNIGGELVYSESVRPGSIIGEFTKKNGQISVSTFVCTTKCTFLTLSTEDYRELLSAEAYSIFHEKITFIEKYFPKVKQVVSSYHRDRIAYSLTSIECSRGCTILSEGENNYDLFFIKNGQLAIVSEYITSGNSELVKLESGNCFGEESALLGIPNKYTIVVCSDTATIYILKKEFLQLIPEDTKEILKNNFSLKEQGRNQLIGFNKKKIKTKPLTPILFTRTFNFSSASSLGKKKLALVAQRYEMDSLYESSGKLNSSSFGIHKRILLQLRNNIQHKSPQAIKTSRSQPSLMFSLNSVSKSFNRRVMTSYGSSSSRGQII
ncbi:unnamed protein product [Blepharisma stoltei]|uniref:Cyclic nucleotide-binding domain-containing protein n=1 Tax=Blepharisma stoltei TaxID=1481888 RepID=A0AAU9J0T2_9CILI|nr:unnamed protein product [Blepharisma stoltei]